ncbi:hypothetical protein [Paenibacillus fonticola]|uniref:hypothetical protein n=1 Tax=Paenibacillus fonticola TaxID=379896 RepID=UPI0003A181BA|nr:hypothetical protein [Paenibacillus fonticola]
MVLNAYQSDSIYAEGGGAKPGITYREILLQHPFITNQAAMSVEGHHFLKDLKFAEELNPEATPKWDVIAFPSNDGQLGSEDSIWIQYVVSINAKSTNINTAWEVVKYINSEEFTRAALKSTLQDSLPTRKEVLSNAAYNLDAFYRPSMNPYLSTTNRKISQSFYDSFQSFSEMKVNEALRGGISLDEMLTSIEQKGQELLLQEKTD